MKPKVKTLKNGLSVLLLPEGSQLTATVLVLVSTGSKYEQKNENGIAHFLEHLCFKGTEKRPSAKQISSELDGLGASYNAFTSYEFTGYYAKVASTHLARAIDLVGDIYCHSRIDKNDVEREKGVIADEINMYEDMPMRKVADLFMSALYGDQPAGWSIAGTKERVAAFTQKEVMKFREKHYVPSATTVVVTGKFDEGEVLAQIKSMFGSLPDKKKVGKKKTIDKQDKPVAVTLYKDSDQTHIIVGVRTYPIHHESRYVMSVLSSILGSGMSSRLFNKIRVELGLGYYVRASNDAHTDHGVLAASLGVDNTRALEAVPAVLGECKRLCEELVSDEELKKVKDMIAGRMFLGLEATDELAERYGLGWLMTKELETPEQEIKKLNKVTAEEVRALARKIFVTKHLTLAAIGPWKNAKEFEKLLKF